MLSCILFKLWIAWRYEGVVLTFLANPPPNRSQLLYKPNIEVEMKELNLHEQYALREDQEAANALVEKWCMNPHLHYCPARN